MEQDRMEEFLSFVDSRNLLPRYSTSRELEYLSSEGMVMEFLPPMTEVYGIAPSQKVELGEFQQVPTRLTHKGRYVLWRLQSGPVPKTGEVCKRSGRYEGDCGHVHRFDRRDSFTTCFLCDCPVVWIWIGR